MCGAWLAYTGEYAGWQGRNVKSLHIFAFHSMHMICCNRKIGRTVIVLRYRREMPLSIVAAVGLFILIAGYTIALLVVCYKLVKGSFLYLVYHNKSFAAFLKNKYQISNINHERRALQKRLQEFEAYEKKLDTWKMQL